MQAIQTKTSQTIRCPNCGCLAERHYLLNQQTIQTQCPSCDYLMVTCSRTGNVVEAYAPGISAPKWVGIQAVV
ncbi:replication restart DNA helicase PriA [Oculatella sp. LEGE 06141]|nr:replication restart DNA helicase PriA [Oculatella sp. LEGE 06141]